MSIISRFFIISHISAGYITYLQGSLIPYEARRVLCITGKVKILLCSCHAAKRRCCCLVVLQPSEDISCPSTKWRRYLHLFLSRRCFLPFLRSPVQRLFPMTPTVLRDPTQMLPTENVVQSGHNKTSSVL